MDVYHTFTMRDWRERARAVHMSCWQLAQYILGPGIEENLELFAAIALQYNFKMDQGGISLPKRISERPDLWEECAYSNFE